MLKKGEVVFPEAKRALALLESKQIPWIAITNGGGVPDEVRRQALSRELEVDVRRLLRLPAAGPDNSSADYSGSRILPRSQIDIRQLVQSHTPLRDSLREKYADEAILVIGGKGQNGRAVAESCVPRPRPPPHR